MYLMIMVSFLWEANCVSYILGLGIELNKPSYVKTLILNDAVLSYDWLNSQNPDKITWEVSSSILQILKLVKVFIKSILLLNQNKIICLNSVSRILYLQRLQNYLIKKKCNPQHTKQLVAYKFSLRNFQIFSLVIFSQISINIFFQNH